MIEVGTLWVVSDRFYRWKEIEFLTIAKKKLTSALQEYCPEWDAGDVAFVVGFEIPAYLNDAVPCRIMMANGFFWTWDHVLRDRAKQIK